MEEIVSEFIKYVEERQPQLCPFSRDSVSKAKFIILEEITFSQIFDIVEANKWEEEPLVIVLERNFISAESEPIRLHSICQVMNKAFSALEFFEGHPLHEKFYRRDPSPNIQINTVTQLRRARKEMHG